jgi:transposase
MAKLANVSVEDLEDAFDEVDGKRETQRLMVAILYKRGPSVPMIAEWLDMRERTIYNWFDRLEERTIEDAITDDQRPSRPAKLSDSECETFNSAVNKPPTESGYDQPAWSTKLAQQFLREEFNTEYSQRTVRRLLSEAGLSHQTPRPQPPTADEDERRQFWQSVKKTD